MGLIDMGLCFVEGARLSILLKGIKGTRTTHFGGFSRIQLLGSQFDWKTHQQGKREESTDQLADTQHPLPIGNKPPKYQGRYCCPLLRLLRVFLQVL